MHHLPPTRQLKKLGDIILEQSKSKIKVRDARSVGQYIFFTSGKRTLFFDDFLCDGENLFLATGGKAVVKYLNGKAAYSTDTYVIKGDEGLNTKFLFNFIKLNLNYINNKLFSGAGIKHLQKKDFKNIEIPLPLLPTQKLIVAKLDEIFANLDKTKAEIQKNMNAIDEVWKSSLNKVFEEGDWNVKELGGVIDLLTDYHANGSYKTLKTNVELKNKKDFALMVRATDLENKNFYEGVNYITKTAYNFLKKTKVFGNEIILPKIGTIGNVYLMPKLNMPISLGMNLFMLRFNSTISPEYIFNYLVSGLGNKQILNKAQGAVTKTITKDAVRSIKIPLPPIQKQKTIVAHLDKLSTETKQLKSKYQSQLENLEELRKSVLDKAFKGELI